MSVAVEIRNLTVAYGNIVAVRGVSFSVPERQVVALLGPNGAGKTSLLGAVAGLVRIPSGQVLVAGTDITGLPAQQIARRGIRLVPENRALFADMNVLENLQVGAGRLSKSERNRRLERIFSLFPQLGERARQTAGTMSGGQQQMLSIARALAAEPQVLLLDEPSMGLAPMIVRSIVETIARLRDDGLTVLVAEQNARAVLPVADRAVLMARGAVVLHDTAADIRTHIESEGYLGGAGASRQRSKEEPV